MEILFIFYKCLIMNIYFSIRTSGIKYHQIIPENQECEKYDIT